MLANFKWLSCKNQSEWKYSTLEPPQRNLWLFGKNSKKRITYFIFTYCASYIKEIYEKAFCQTNRNHDIRTIVLHTFILSSEKVDKTNLCFEIDTILKIKI